MKKLMKMKPLISALEPRILYDGAAVVTAVDALDNSDFDTTTDTTTEDTSDVSTVTEAFSEEKSVDTSSVETSTDTTEIYFIDSSVDDYESIVESLGDDAEVYIIDSESDGLEQIADILEDMDDIDAIHIISHGDVGEITIGSTTLDEDSLDTYSDILETIGESLSEDGDILLYGCSVAEDGEGESFVDALAEATGADVAASDDTTGAQALGGDWDLEYESGVVETEAINIESYESTLGESTTYTFSTASGGYDDPAILYAYDVDYTDGGTLTITAYDVDYGDGDAEDELDQVSISYDGGVTWVLVYNEYGDTYLRGENSSSSTTTFTIDAFEFADGIDTLMIKIEMVSSYTGWVFDVTETTLTVFNNTAPTADDSTVTIDEDTSYALSASDFNFSDVDTDTDGDALEAVMITDLPDNGTLTLNGEEVSEGDVISISDIEAGYLVFTPDSDESGSSYAEIGFKVYDGYEYSDSENTITFNVDAVNDAPEIQVVDVTGTIEEGTTLSDSGSITFSDVELSDTPDASITNTSVTSDDITLTTEQIAAITSAFSISAASDNSYDGTINWTFDIDESDLDFLAEGEVVTATFTITVDDGNGGTVTQDVVVTITGSNDAVVASTDSIEMEESFGTEFTLDISTYFSDVDLTDDMTFTITGLPDGLTYDAETGIISGTLEDIGSFTITIIADDQDSDVSLYSSSESSSATITLALDILAPAETVTTPVDIPADEIIEVVETEPEISSGSSGDDITNEDTEDSAAVSEILNETETIVSEVDTLEDVASSIVLSSTTESSAEGLVRSADVTVSVDASGQVTFDDTIESVDFSLQSINLSADNTVIIDIRDDYRSEQEVYSASYDGGKALPAELSLDRLTGQISGTIPDYMIDADGDIKIEISAYNPTTNETRILKIKMNINDLKESVSSAPDVAYIPFNGQLEMANEKLNNYGDNLSKLFSDQVA